ncbi:hypothetical protein Tco_0300916 [Tanacetum coccineum]
MNNQLQTSSNVRNNARGNVVAGNAGGQNRDGNVNPGQAKPIVENITNFDDDVDDLALNVDHVFEADQCDAFDSDVDEAPTTQTMFMVNLSSEDPIYDEVGPSYDSNTPFEVQDHDTFVDHMDEYHEVHESKIMDLKAQLEGNLKVATRSSVKTKVLAPGMYAIDVKPIPHPLKNNRSAHLNYINHLIKESVEIVREILRGRLELVKPLDNALNYACQYTKLSQELLEYVIGTCPKSFNERDNKAPSTPVTRKKQVTLI